MGAAFEIELSRCDKGVEILWGDREFRVEICPIVRVKDPIDSIKV